MDWSEACRILGVPESATEAVIKDQYVYKAQLLHPDKNQNKPENIRKRAEIELALVNQAYSFLNNSNNNPYKIPPKLAVEPCGIIFNNINVGEKKNATLVIRNIGGPYTSIWIDNHPASWLAITEVKSITSERLPLEVTLECTGTGENGAQHSCNLLIKLENENTQKVDSVDVKIELFTNINPAESVLGEDSRAAVNKYTSGARADDKIYQTSDKNRLGFSIKAFLVDIFAFAIVGIISGFLISIFFTINNVFFIPGLIIYSLLSFGFSFYHAITIGSKIDKSASRDKPK
jgi:hypothetical protein